MDKQKTIIIIAGMLLLVICSESYMTDGPHQMLSIVLAIILFSSFVIVLTFIFNSSEVLLNDLQGKMIEVAQLTTALEEEQKQREDDKNEIIDGLLTCMRPSSVTELSGTATVTDQIAANLAGDVAEQVAAYGRVMVKLAQVLDIENDEIENLK